MTKADKNTQLSRVPLILLLKRTLPKVRRNILNEEMQENEMPPSLIPWKVLESIAAEQCF